MTLVEESVKGYDAFKRRVEELKKERGGDKIFVLFTGSKDVEGRRSWCPDCNDLEEVFTKFKGKHTLEGVLLKVDVGGRDEWKDKNSPFRTDRLLKLTSIPTLMQWGTPKRLSEATVLKEDALQMLFVDED